MAKNNDNEYFYALGRRKTAVATVRLYEGNGKSTVNGMDLEKVYSSPSEKQQLEMPFEVTDTKGKFYFTVKSSGGGISGQLGAIRLGIARALVKYDESLKSELKKKGLMTRDPRMVERKKTGLKKARRAPQFSKR
ncbi:30S ribosomal protein S9 [Candidatus Dojkabacteria bacterium]|uniref:Small ribosomal subunit protein uS9 n=1 Tax=Candidatus Dojkabacteria bacterium TaxID=2099670 RepID=A0A955L8R6_9BACT|nr:30S ribosomal protein S9 [Candidatus Dojkabacteria bacterium]